MLTVNEVAKAARQGECNGRLSINSISGTLGMIAVSPMGRPILTFT